MATKNYVDTKVSDSGGSSSLTTDLNMNAHRIINVVDPVNV